MKRQIILTLALISLATSMLLTSCKKKEGFDLNLTLSTSEREMLLELCSQPQDSLFLLAVKTADSLAAEDTTDFFGLFYNAWKLKSPDSLFKPLFLSNMKEKSDSAASEEGVIDWMRKEYRLSVEKTAEVLKKRLDDYDLYDFNVRISDTLGILVVKMEGVKDTATALDLVRMQGKLGFWETYEFADVYEHITRADAVLHAMMVRAAARKKSDSTSADSTAVDTAGGQQTEAQKYAFDHPLFARLKLNLVKEKNVYNPATGPVVGTCKLRDTAKFHQLMAYPSVEALFPEDLVMTWAFRPADEQKKELELLALKKAEGTCGSSICGCMIVKAEASIEEGKSTEILMSLNENGTVLWAEMTQKNIGRSIAIVIDGYAYTWPVVQSKIEKGNSMITGNFTPAEAEKLALILRMGALPLRLTIEEMQVSGEPYVEEQ